MKAYDVGDTARIKVNFKNIVRVDTDPTGVTLKVKIPSGTTTTYTYGVDLALVKDSTGNYHYDLTLLTAGAYYYKWTGTGPASGVEEGVLTAQATNIT